MALLKSIALQVQELQQKNADECYQMLEGWSPDFPVITPIVELPARTAKEDIKPFGYDFSHLPSRNVRRQRIFSEI